MTMLNEYEYNDLKNYDELTTKHFKKRLKENRSPIFVINLSSDLHKMTDNLISSVKKKGTRFGCENGCSYCCTLRVESFAPEIFYIRSLAKVNLRASNSPFQQLNSFLDQSVSVYFYSVLLISENV